MESSPQLLKEAARKKVEYLRKSLPKRMKAPLPESSSVVQAPPPPRAPSERSSTPGGAAHQGTTVDAFAKVRLHCIMEYKTSEVFKGELLNASTIGFI